VCDGGGWHHRRQIPYHFRITFDLSSSFSPCLMAIRTVAENGICSSSAALRSVSTVASSKVTHSCCILLSPILLATSQKADPYINVSVNVDNQNLLTIS